MVHGAWCRGADEQVMHEGDGLESQKTRTKDKEEESRRCTNPRRPKSKKPFSSRRWLWQQPTFSLSVCERQAVQLLVVLAARQRVHL